MKLDAEQVRLEIAALRGHLGATISEKVLLAETNDRLGRLRAAYPNNRRAFDRDSIQFLKEVRAFSVALAEFVAACEEAQDVASVAECKDLIDRLTRLQRELANAAVSRRIEKEIRELKSRIPVIAASERHSRESRFYARKAELEEKAPRCSRGHAMVIRSVESGMFWGCTQYPFCRNTASLSVEQERLLCKFV
jgi:hypothetical protein